LLLAAVLAVVSAAWLTPLHHPQNFLAFMQKYNRTYTGMEKKRRMHIFSANMIWAESLGPSYGIGPFADLTQDEFHSKYTSSYKRNEKRPEVTLAKLSGKIPASVDWRNQGAVTRVKDQGQCGSCWAFSTTEEIESMNFMSTGNLVELSVQQIVSCDTVDQGCNGGDTVTAYQYVQGANGLCLGSQYPYTSGGGNTGTCQSFPTPTVDITGFTYATPPCTGGSCQSQNETQMQDACSTNGPVSVCLVANDAWQVYTGGLFTAACSSNYNDMNHCVQVVGYSSTGGQPYWIVRNSWNTDWGNNGYIWIPMGSNDCSIASEATFATI
jgi:C1A family cysteine protease